MGERGPAKEPSALKAVKGTADPKQVANEPVPTGPVVAPENLTDSAREVWDRLAPDLERKGVLTAWDVDLFAMFCTAVADWDEADQRVQAEGSLVDAPVFDRNGKQTGSRTQKSPWLAVRRDAFEMARSLGSRFGLTPSDRASVRAHASGEVQSPDRLLT